jgi:arsenite methyltransferase
VSADPLSALALAPDRQLTPEELKSCCASVYADPAVRWLLGEELHPGGETATGRALELLAVERGDWLLDVASGGGASALKAVRELGCRAVGVEYGEAAVLGARAQAEAEGLGGRASFLRGDAEALPLTSGSFDAVLCECSLCTFPDKARALAEMRRVLRPGGRVVISDVVVDPERLPHELLGPLSTIACVGSALSRGGYEGLLGDAGLEPFAVESREPDAARFASRVEERLRGARLLGLGRLSGSPIEIETAIELAGLARQAIAEGSLGYAIIAARDSALEDG